MVNQKFEVLERKINEIKMDILEHGMLTAGEEWNFKQIVSPFNRLYFILDGEAWIENKENKIKLEKGNVYLIPAGTCYDYKSEHYLKMLYVHFQIQIIPGIDLFSRCMEALALNGVGTETALLVDNLMEENLYKIMETKSVLFSVISQFLKKAEQITGGMENYRGFERQHKVISYLEKKLAADLKVSEIAEMLGQSYFSLSRNFKSDTGIGLKEYMEILLMNRGRRMLLMTDMRIGEIAESLGFADTYYFSKFFHKYEKLSPREYRKRKIL